MVDESHACLLACEQDLLGWGLGTASVSQNSWLEEYYWLDTPNKWACY